MGVNNDIVSEILIVSGFGEPGGTPPPGIPRNAYPPPPGHEYIAVLGQSCAEVIA